MFIPAVRVAFPQFHDETFIELNDRIQTLIEKKCDAVRLNQILSWTESFRALAVPDFGALLNLNREIRALKFDVEDLAIVREVPPTDEYLSRSTTNTRAVFVVFHLTEAVWYQLQSCV